MAELLYIASIVDADNSIIETIHSQRYSLGFVDFFFTENDKTIDFVGKVWTYKTNIYNAINNGKKKLEMFKKRYKENKDNGLYLDEKSEKEIKEIFGFIQSKIEKLYTIIDENPEKELYLFSDLSEVLFMYDLERDIVFGDNRNKQEKYINDLIDGKFSTALETKEMHLAKEKLKDLRTALLRQARIIYIPELEEDPTLWFFKEHILVKTIFITQVYDKALYDNPQHNEIISYAIKAIQPSIESRNTIVDFNREESADLLLEGKLKLNIFMLLDKPE